MYISPITSLEHPYSLSILSVLGPKLLPLLVDLHVGKPPKTPGERNNTGIIWSIAGGSFAGVKGMAFFFKNFWGLKSLDFLVKYTPEN